MSTFTEMRCAALALLQDIDPEKAAQRTGMTFDGNFHTITFGTEVRISYPDYIFEPRLEDWHELVILHALAKGDGAPQTGILQTFAYMKDGMVRGGGFDRQCETTLQHRLADVDSEHLTAKCRALGAYIADSNADLQADFAFLPCVPVTLKVWFPEEDEDLPGSGRMLVDRAIDHYLSVEDAVTVGGLLLDRLMNPTTFE